MDSRYNTLDEDYNIDYLDGGIKIFYKYNLKFTPQLEEWVTYNEIYEDKIIEIVLSEEDKIQVNDDEEIEKNYNDVQLTPSH